MTWDARVKVLHSVIKTTIHVCGPCLNMVCKKHPLYNTLYIVKTDERAHVPQPMYLLKLTNIVLCYLRTPQFRSTALFVGDSRVASTCRNGIEIADENDKPRVTQPRLWCPRNILLFVMWGEKKMVDAPLLWIVLSFFQVRNIGSFIANA